VDEQEERKRRGGKVVLDRMREGSRQLLNEEEDIQRRGKGMSDCDDPKGKRSVQVKVEMKEEEDIFGKKEKSFANAETSGDQSFAVQDMGEVSAGPGSGNDSAPGTMSVSKGKRIRVPQQILDNKAVCTGICFL